MWAEEKKCKAKAHSSQPCVTPSSPQSPTIPADKPFLPLITKLNLARVFICLFIYFLLNFLKKKNSVQGKNGIRPKSKQISALKSYLNRQYIKFLYL